MFVLLEKWRGDQIDLSHQKKTTLKSPVLLGLTKYGCHLVFSELLAGRNSLLSKHAGHFFQKCWPPVILSTKYAGHSVFSELLTGRNSFTKLCRPFSFSDFIGGLPLIDRLPVMQTLRIFYLAMTLPIAKESIKKCKESQVIQTKYVFEIFILFLRFKYS